MSCCTYNAIVTSLVGRNLLLITSLMKYEIRYLSSVGVGQAIISRSTVISFIFPLLFVPIFLSDISSAREFALLTLIRYPISKYSVLYVKKNI